VKKNKGKKYKKPKPGDTVFCWVGGDAYMSHKLMLFLGPDKEAADKLLVQSTTLGWTILLLSDLPKGTYRPTGKVNIIDETIVKKTNRITKFVYSFYDNGPVMITVRLFRGVWRIKTKFKMPSWVIEN